VSRREQEWYEVEKKDGAVLAKAVIKEEKGRWGLSLRRFENRVTCKAILYRLRDYCTGTGIVSKTTDVVSARQMCDYEEVGDKKTRGDRMSARIVVGSGSAADNSKDCRRFFTAAK
jgi:hypothetical protein